MRSNPKHRKAKPIATISQFKMVTGGVLKASAGGAAFSLDVTIGANTQLCITTKLAKMAISLDDRPLLELLDSSVATGGSFESDAARLVGFRFSV